VSEIEFVTMKQLEDFEKSYLWRAIQEELQIQLDRARDEMEEALMNGDAKLATPLAGACMILRKTRMFLVQTLKTSLEIELERKEVENARRSENNE